jgi:hypothetical protein
VINYDRALLKCVRPMLPLEERIEDYMPFNCSLCLSYFVSI